MGIIVVVVTSGDNGIGGREVHGGLSGDGNWW